MDFNNQKKITEFVAFWIFRFLTFSVVGLLILILGFLVYNGISVISWDFLTKAPEDGMTGGGIFPAIVGTMYLVVGSI